MHRRIVAAVSAVLFALVAFMVVLLTDLHDRDYPEQLHAKSTLHLDFSRSGLSDDEAFRQLGSLSDRLGVGLVKIAPDLAEDQSGEVFVEVGSAGHLPQSIDRFGNEPEARVEGQGALAHSYASGQYLATGDSAGMTDLQTWLHAHGVIVTQTDDTAANTLQWVLRQGSFVTTILAAVALMVSLVLYWLSVRAKGRALRVLAGAPTWRIQYEDLTAFFLATSGAALVCCGIGTLYVGAVHGWSFVSYYARTLLLLDAIVVAVTLLSAVVISMASWPSVQLLASRTPAVTSLRKASAVLKCGSFILVLVAVAPAYAAYAESNNAATQQAQWKSLADQVGLSFSSAGGESGFEAMMPSVGDAVAEAERSGSVALSYTLTDSNAGRDLAPYHNISLVNQKWLDLMSSHAGGGSQDKEPQAKLEPLAPSRIPGGTRQFLGEDLQLWSREKVAPEQVLAKMTYYQFAHPAQLPLSLGGNGDLIFPDDALVVVVPDLHATLNDSFLASVASTRNLMFTGLGPTLSLLERHGLQYKVQARYVAEEGILRAQFAAYFAWLQAISLAALFVALVVSTLVSAFITAVLKSRRDFPLRLAGRSWVEVLRERVLREGGAALVLTVLVLLARGFSGGVLVALVALVGIIAVLVSPFSHLVATRWTFARMATRGL